MVSKIKSQTLYETMPKELIPCGVCGSSEHIKVFDRKDFELGIDMTLCKHCGFLFTNPRPLPEAISEFYRKDYRRSDSNPAKKPKEYADAPSPLRRAFWFNDLIKPKFDKEGIRAPRILDVGCGLGIVLHAFRERFPQSQLFGVEPSPAFSAVAAERNNATVFTGGIETFVAEQKALRGSFDLITLVHVLEHLYEPVEKLAALREFLRPGGYLMLQVPTPFSAGCPKVRRMFHIAHVNQFSADTLRWTLERAGFNEIQNCESSPRVITYLCRKTENALAKDAVPVLPSGKADKLAETVRGKIADEHLASLHPARQSAIKRWTAVIKGTIAAALNAPVLRKKISGKKVLILGSGPSAAELKSVPADMLLFTCNRGPVFAPPGSLQRPIDLYFCSAHLMKRSKLRKIVPAVQQIGADLFMTDNPAGIRRIKELKGRYSRLLYDNYVSWPYLGSLAAEAGLDAEDIPALSDEMRLLLYALRYGASEIHVLGVDLWDSGNADEKLAACLAAKFKHIHSFSRVSAVARYFKPA